MDAPEHVSPETLAVQAVAETRALSHTVTTLRRTVIFMLAAGIVALALGITWVYVQSYQGRKEVVATQRLGCVRGLLDRADAIGSNLDDADFRQSAAEARAGSRAALAAALKRERHGLRQPTADLQTAVEYAHDADDARDRAVSAQHRLLGASFAIVAQRIPHGSRAAGDPTPAALDAARTACGRAYPGASPWPWASPNPMR